MADQPQTTPTHLDWLQETFAKNDGESAAVREIRLARIAAEAKIARLFAERECPADLKEWGRSHGIPTFAEMTWQAGFQAGMRVAMLGEKNDEPK